MNLIGELAALGDILFLRDDRIDLYLHGASGGFPGNESDAPHVCIDLSHCFEHYSFS